MVPGEQLEALNNISHMIYLDLYIFPEVCEYLNDLGTYYMITPEQCNINAVNNETKRKTR